MQAQIAPRRRRLQRALELLLLGHAERNIVLTKSGEHLLLEPALVAELHREAAPRRKQSEESFQPLEILLHVRRQLKENRPHPVRHRGRVAQQKVERAGGVGFEPRVVGDAHARLDGERELLGHLRRPFTQHVLLRQAVERVVDLDRGIAARVVAEPRVIGQVGRIENALPLLERKAAGPGEEPHDTRRSASCWSPPRARLAFSASMRSMIFPPPASGVTSFVMSWPSTLRWIVSSTRSRTVSRYFCGSKDSFDVCSMSCFASASSVALISPGGMATSVVGRTSSA